nr:hypothetical protein [Dyella sp. ASV24]
MANDHTAESEDTIGAVNIGRIARQAPSAATPDKWAGSADVTKFGFSVVVMVICLLLLYASDQSVALGRSISAYLHDTGLQTPNHGFVCDFWGFASWVVCATSLAVVLWCFGIGAAPVANQKPWERWGRVVAYLLLIYPLLLFPVVVQVSVDLWSVYAYLILIGPLGILAYFTYLHGWKGLLGALAFLLTTMACAWYDEPRWVLIVVIGTCAVDLLIEYLRKKGKKPGRDEMIRDWGRRGLRLAVYLAGVAAILFGTLALDPVMEPYIYGHHRQSPTPILLAVWWLLPAALVTIAAWCTTRQRAPRPWMVFVCVAVVLCACLFLGRRQTAVSFLCIVASVVLFAGYLLTRFSRRRMVVWMFSVGGAVAFLIAIYQLSPAIDLEKPVSPALRPASAGDEQFADFYDSWLKARGETRADHGVIVLVAAAGGGIRAAEHSAIALAAMDDVTKGAFGSRVFAVSAVSGGSLGVWSWVAARRAGILNPDKPRDTDMSLLPGAWRLANYYSNDFVSPVVQRMLVGDFLTSAMPLVTGHSTRDQVLVHAWEDGWRSLVQTYDSGAGVHDVFNAELSSLRDDPAHLPMMIFNATSASDGRRVVYSSVAAGFTGAWLARGDAKVTDAVLDSARFALVSPVGATCAKSDVSMETDRGVCPDGYHRIAVADGGYADNSGLASINDIVDKLVANGVGLDKIYVIAISSDPTENIGVKEGTRFDNGRLLAETLAPAYVMESARAGRSTMLADIVEKKLAGKHFLRWDLTQERSLQFWQKRYLDDKADAGHGFFARWDVHRSRANLKRQLDMAPLGWTLDSDSAGSVFTQAVSHSFPSCGEIDAKDRCAGVLTPSPRPGMAGP